VRSRCPSENFEAGDGAVALVDAIAAIVAAPQNVAVSPSRLQFDGRSHHDRTNVPRLPSPALSAEKHTGNE
jgi:hypothetical protein